MRRAVPAVPGETDDGADCDGADAAACAAAAATSAGPDPAGAPGPPVPAAAPATAAADGIALRQVTAAASGKATAMRLLRRNARTKSPVSARLSFRSDWRHQVQPAATAPDWF